MNILNAQTRIDVLKTSAGLDVAGATKIFEKESGEVGENNRGMPTGLQIAAL
jgi:hypothetical protein